MNERLLSMVVVELFPASLGWGLLTQGLERACIPALHILPGGMIHSGVEHA